MANKVMTWGMILMLFIGQSYTYASVPCESNSDASFMQLNMQRMIKQNMHQEMQGNPQQQEPAMDCCDHECSCPTGTCSSAVLAHFAIISPLNLVSYFSGSYLFSIQDAFLASLRKPPIVG